ncbi:uncharacterized protein C05D11.1-like isoform X1 [Eriocheir sinensis]|uniref:uncharacterized protein C05D11.1-like isoform X1 n=2 Tax=Eriocheir sinensis TaxID=95602 RepID=UPI0021C8397C|nr:uncharacterized protein C05D11.1-like isoform X1 [Eriocheir sinensis]XP_050697307.1 uncharacterized protein C05D11.1-like isoform X1 [Eriocheir sinensis]
MTFRLALRLALLTTAVMAAPNQPQRQGNSTKSLADNYEYVCELRASGSVPVAKYRSKRTGLHIVLARIEGPLVNGYFTVATEAHDDDGLPHTLEHLIFLGSEDYPYKGILDLLANRCLASGTNAWTDTDHTAYTVQTAGSEGFLNLLPIYLDHLLYPTLTDSAFVTEVYHITGEGEDAGVVYSEMQGRENTDSDLCLRAMLRAMYPPGSGYRSETGGIMKNLRESTTNEKIRKYHHEFYRPENLHVIITGMVGAEQVFEALEPIEQKIMSKGDRGPFTRPWQSPVPPLQASVDELVLYPSDTEDTGMVLASWRGPSAVNEITELMSMSVLMEYLTHSSVSPLPKIFVEVDDPLASSVHHSCFENSVSACYFVFNGVPKEKVNSVSPLLMDTLGKIGSGEMPIDMATMKDILSNLILLQDSSLETVPHDTIANSAIGDALYGKTCENLDVRLNKKSWYEVLLRKSCQYWTDLVCKYFLEGHSVVVRGVPSIAESTRLEEEEKARSEARKTQLGEEGLKMWKEKVEKAKETNEIPAPTAMLELVPVPGLESIHFHPLTAYNNHLENHPITIETYSNSTALATKPQIGEQLHRLPIKFQLDDLHSNFVEMAAILDTSQVPPAKLSYLTLLLDLIFESPILRDGSLIPYEEVVRDLAADTLSREASVGLVLRGGRRFSCGSFCNNAAVVLKVEMAQYEKGVQWLREALFRSQFVGQRVRVKANKLINSIGDRKRSGPKLLDLMFHNIVFKKTTNQNQQSILKQEKFLNSLLERLDTEEEVVLRDLEEVRQAITAPERITIHMATDLEKLSVSTDPFTAWMTFLDANKTSPTKEKFLNVIPDSSMHSYEDLGAYTGYLSGVGSVESGYLLQATRSITEHRDWDLPPLLTAIQYLTQLEGPMWREIRGRGLAYSSNLYLNPAQGLLILKLLRASQLTRAYKEALNILNSHINGTTAWENTLLESARSSLMFEVIEREAVVTDVAQQSLLSYFRKVPQTYTRELIDRIAKVTLEDVKRVALKYFTPLVHPKTSKTVVVCHPSNIKETISDLEKFGQNLNVVEALESSRFA